MGQNSVGDWKSIRVGRPTSRGRMTTLEEKAEQICREHMQDFIGRPCRLDCDGRIHPDEQAKLHAHFLRHGIYVHTFELIQGVVVLRGLSEAP